MNKFQKHSNSECYTPEPFGSYCLLGVRDCDIPVCDNHTQLSRTVSQFRRPRYMYIFSLMTDQCYIIFGDFEVFWFSVGWIKQAPKFITLGRLD
jgi:hypothetical protein